MNALPLITLDLFRSAATEFAREMSATPYPHLYGATDGKAVGTALEASFKTYLQERYHLEVGNAANGLDFPSLNLDLKVTSLKQPQSSCPFRSATQKIYGLGYNLLVIVYVKRDDPEQRAAFLEIEHVIFVDQERTGDSTLTGEIRRIIETGQGRPEMEEVVVEELDALLQDKNLPLDDASRRELAERLVVDVPKQGVLTISNALQWRLQYRRAIVTAATGSIAPQVMELRA